MELGAAQKIFDQLFSEVNGFQLSYSLQNLENNEDIRNRDLTYGEIDFQGFFKILLDVPGIQERKVFYDLGSGVGKAVVAAALLGAFEEVVGVEILPGLHREAVKVSEFLPTVNSQITFLQKNFLEVDLSRADLVYTHSTCFSKDLMCAMEKAFESLPAGAIVLTVSQSLPKMEIIKTGKYPFSWGEGTVYFHLKS